MSMKSWRDVEKTSDSAGRDIMTLQGAGLRETKLPRREDYPQAGECFTSAMVDDRRH